eukprot:881166_1
MALQKIAKQRYIWLLCSAAIVLLQFILGLRILPSAPPPEYPQEISLIGAHPMHSPNQLLDAESRNQSNMTRELFLCWRMLVRFSITTNRDMPCHHSSLWHDTHTLVSDIAISLNRTNAELNVVLHTYAISYHKLTYLRRAMMMIEALPQSTHTGYPKPNSNIYHDTLRLIVFILNKIHIEKGRHLFPFYAIHIPRSSGTTLCSAFRRIAKQQSTAHALRDGSFNMVMDPTKNCNYNGSNNFMTEYTEN